MKYDQPNIVTHVDSDGRGCAAISGVSKEVLDKIEALVNDEPERHDFLAVDYSGIDRSVLFSNTESSRKRLHIDLFDGKTLDRSVALSHLSVRYLIGWLQEWVRIRDEGRS